LFVCVSDFFESEREGERSGYCLSVLPSNALIGLKVNCNQTSTINPKIKLLLFHPVQFFLLFFCDFRIIFYSPHLATNCVGFLKKFVIMTLVSIFRSTQISSDFEVFPKPFFVEVSRVIFEFEVCA